MTPNPKTRNSGKWLFLHNKQSFLQICLSYKGLFYEIVQFGKLSFLYCFSFKVTNHVTMFISSMIKEWDVPISYFLTLWCLLTVIFTLPKLKFPVSKWLKKWGKIQGKSGLVQVSRGFEFIRFELVGFCWSGSTPTMQIKQIGEIASFSSRKFISTTDLYAVNFIIG